MTRSRWTLRAVILILALGIVAAGYVAWLSLQPSPYGFAGGHHLALAEYQGATPTGVPPELAGESLVRRGEYLTRMADCEACHTAAGGARFAGGRAFRLPFGTIYTPNITPDNATGIGQWSDAEFLRAVHQGIGRGGERLYPAFPYASYTLLEGTDVLAIKAYLFSLPPVRQANQPNTFRFPFNQRWTMAIWSLLFNSNRRFQPVQEQSPQWNRGAYLAEAAAHCGECHTPRNLLQAMDQRRKFAGGAAEGWNAYDITSNPQSGIGGWSEEELETYLSSGHARGRGVASGPMAEAVGLSLSQLTHGDIAAMATYLRTVPAALTASLPAVAGPAPAEPQRGPTDNLAGKRIFEGNCASCHAWSGMGALLTQAQLTGDRAVNDPSAKNVVAMILTGSGSLPAGRPYMPAFAAAYTDGEIAAVANYVTARFGAVPSSVTANEVALLRQQR